MPYSELIKNFGRIRDYMRDFFVYGFKTRAGYAKKSARSYDDEKRRLESWLGDYMRFRQTAEGKTVFLSIDSRAVRHNPLYAAWKAKSFTDGDITLHFLLFDLLHDPAVSLALGEIMGALDGYLAQFPQAKMYDESTVRKKLKEYGQEGLIRQEKQGKTVTYRRGVDAPLPDVDALHFFSETAPCGVVGSFLLDKLDAADGADSPFAFKHHYITSAMDSEVVCELFTAMGEKRCVTLETISRRQDKAAEKMAVPLRLMVSTGSGRQYLMAYLPRQRRIASLRTDNILSVKTGDVCPDFDVHRQTLRDMERRLWGVSTESRTRDRLGHIAFTVHYAPDEMHIHNRLVREKRCGRVEKLDVTSSRFSADVYDPGELLSWVRTFICRITDFTCSDKAVEARFFGDLEAMYRLYGVEGSGE